MIAYVTLLHCKRWRGLEGTETIFRLTIVGFIMKTAINSLGCNLLSSSLTTAYFRTESHPNLSGLAIADIACVSYSCVVFVTD